MSKTNTAVYIYDHLISVLIAAAFIVFDHAKNKKSTLKCFRKEGGNVWVLEGETVKKKGANCFIYRQSKKIILEPNNKIDFIFVSLLELLWINPSWMNSKL